MLVTGQVHLGEVASRLDAPVPVRISRLFEEELGGGGQPKRGMPLRTRPPDEVVRRFRLAACIARWLNAGVPIAEVARRVGNLPELSNVDITAASTATSGRIARPPSRVMQRWISRLTQERVHDFSFGSCLVMAACACRADRGHSGGGTLQLFVRRSE